MLEILSKEEIQRELREAVCNDIDKQLDYNRTVDQCRAKIKALKTEYKYIMDKLRRSVPGRE